MKAIRLHTRGGPERLVYEDAPEPTLAEGDVLVRVYGSGVTPSELTWGSNWKDRKGENRLPSIPGHELSGVVALVGPGAAGVAIGDAVYALTDFWRDGSAAESIAVSAADLAPKPSSLGHAHAAAVPLSALTAWQALFEQARLAAGQRVLIHGAAGGVGSFAVQLAHIRGARVVATAAGGDTDFVRGLGADEVIDYRATRFEEVVQGVDAVLDTVGGDTLERSVGVLRRGGTLVSTVAAPSQEQVAPHGIRGLTFIVEPNRGQLIEIAQLIDGGKLQPILAGVLPLMQAREAYERGLAGGVRGKLVLRVPENPG
ncbi:MAG: NADP-dependent oxidoreductase [Gemmatimonadales bacterium]